MFPFDDIIMRFYTNIFTLDLCMTNINPAYIYVWAWYEIYCRELLFLMTMHWDYKCAEQVIITLGGNSTHIFMG